MSQIGSSGDRVPIVALQLRCIDGQRDLVFCRREATRVNGSAVDAGSAAILFQYFLDWSDLVSNRRAVPEPV